MVHGGQEIGAWGGPGSTGELGEPGNGELLVLSQQEKGPIRLASCSSLTGKQQSAQSKPALQLKSKESLSSWFAPTSKARQVRAKCVSAFSGILCLLVFFEALNSQLGAQSIELTHWDFCNSLHSIKKRIPPCGYWY